MAIIEFSVIVQEDRKKVYEFLKNIEQFPSFMENVKEIKVLKKYPNKLITTWNIEIDGANILWQEEDIFNDKNFSVKFRMLEGDYNKYEGNWTLTSIDNKTRISIYINIDWGAPAFTKFVEHTLERKAKRAIKGMVIAFKKKIIGKSR